MMYDYRWLYIYIYVHMYMYTPFCLRYFGIRNDARTSFIQIASTIHDLHKMERLVAFVEVVSPLQRGSCSRWFWFGNTQKFRKNASKFLVGLDARLRLSCFKNALCLVEIWMQSSH